MAHGKVTISGSPGVRVGMSITQNYRDSNEIIGLSVSFSSDDQQAVKCKVCIVLSSILK